MAIKFEVGALSGLFGFLVGITGGILVESFNDKSREAKIFQEPNQPKVLRVYNESAVDSIFVQNPNDPNYYEPLKVFLDSITDKYDRKIKESEIKKLVEW